MAFKFKWLGMAWLALALLVGHRDVVAAEPAPDPAIWGIYSQLVGTTWEGESGRAEWQWGADNSIVERRMGRVGKVIRPGARPGELVASYGGKRPEVLYNGRIAADGSVLWIFTVDRYAPTFREAIVDGSFHEERVKLDDAQQVAKVKRTYVNHQTGGTPVTAVTIATPAVAPAAATTASVAAPTAQAPVAQGALAPATAVAPTQPAAPAPGFGWLEDYVGRSFVGTTPIGGAYTLRIFREGDAMVLDQGGIHGNSFGRVVIRPGQVPGAFEVDEVSWESDASKNSLPAYFAGSPGAPATSPLDGYDDPRKPGDLVVGYNVPGMVYGLLILHRDGNNLSYDVYRGNRRFGMRMAPTYYSSGWFSPATAQETARVQASSNAVLARRAEERRQDELDQAEEQQLRQERAAQWAQTQGASEQALADSISRLNNTVATVEAQQAQYRAQQEAMRAQQEAATRANDVQRAREATERQDEIARQNEARRTAVAANAPALTVESRPATATTAAPTKAGGGNWYVYCVAIKPGAYMDAPGALFLSSISTIAKAGYSNAAAVESFGSRVSAQYGVSAGSASCNALPDHATAQARWQEHHDSAGLKFYKKVVTGMPATP